MRADGEGQQPLRSHVISAHKARIEAGDYVAVIFVAETPHRLTRLKERLREDRMFVFSDLKSRPRLTAKVQSAASPPAKPQPVIQQQPVPEVTDADRELARRLRYADALLDRLNFLSADREVAAEKRRFSLTVRP